MNYSHEFWMQKALKEAKLAMERGELPIGCVVVGGDEEISRGQTQVGRKGSMAAHGELLALLEAGKDLYTCNRPIKLYTTLEPCVMCLGASLNCEVDQIIYAMAAPPDGGAKYSKIFKKGGHKTPEILPNILKEEAVELMKKFIDNNPSHFGVNYAKLLIDE